MKGASMRSSTTLHSHSLMTLLFSFGALSIWGCAEGGGDGTGGTTGAETTTGTGAAGGGFQNSSSSNAGGGPPVCVATTEKAEATPLDMLFVLDWSGSMQGES